MVTTILMAASTRSCTAWCPTILPICRQLIHLTRQLILQQQYYMFKWSSILERKINLPSIKCFHLFLVLWTLFRVDLVNLTSNLHRLRSIWLTWLGNIILRSTSRQFFSTIVCFDGVTTGTVSTQRLRSIKPDLFCWSY